MKHFRYVSFLVIGFLILLCSQQSLAEDYTEELRPYFVESMNRGLPLRFFLDLFRANAWISVKPSNSGPYYQPGYFSGGTIYHGAVGTPLNKWTRLDFTSFYNELFHAWWGNVFMKEQRFASERAALLNDSKRTQKYTLAHPGNPRLAQEEAYSETVGYLILLAYPLTILDPETKQPYKKIANLEELYYRIEHTVAPVGHGDRPGFTEIAESTFPDEREYSWLFEKLFRRNPPAPKQP